MENKQAPAGTGRDAIPLMDPYTIAGLAATVLVAGLVGFRLARDERLLRRKRPMLE